MIGTQSICIFMYNLSVNYYNTNYNICCNYFYICIKFTFKLTLKLIKAKKNATNIHTESYVELFKSMLFNKNKKFYTLVTYVSTYMQYQIAEN